MLIFKMENAETSAKILTERAFLEISPQSPGRERNMVSNTRRFTNPWHAAASSFLAFSVGSLPQCSRSFLFPTAYRIPVTVFVVGLSLIFTGYTSAKLGKAPTKPAMLRNLIIGLLTMGVTYFFGQLFGI